LFPIKKEIDFQMFRSFVSVFGLLLFSGAATAQSTHKLMRQGDKAYDFENYQEAEKHYRDAADLKYGDPLAQYNLGNALYKQGKWDDAATRFEQAARQADTPAFEADALHNLGNAQMKLHKFKEAVEAYENSLRLRPGDAETKQNLQMAKKKLKEEEEKQRQEQQQQEEQQQQQSQSEQDQQNQQNNQQDQQNQPQQNQQPQQPGEQQLQQKRQEQQTEKLKKEEARRLLETAIGPEDQKNARKYRELRQQPKPNSTKKDW
jgi:tetratricopeptide (TPR) repeat protein